jgi:hypothetical protein
MKFISCMHLEHVTDALTTSFYIPMPNVSNVNRLSHSHEPCALQGYSEDGSCH